MTWPRSLGRLSIRQRLFLILAVAASAVMVASVVAIVAMIDIRTEFDGVAGTDLPETTAALRLAQTGERLQGRASAIVAATSPQERAQQEALIETDIQALGAELNNLRAIRGTNATLVTGISDAAQSLRERLRLLSDVLETKWAMTAKRALAVSEVLSLQDQFKQIIGPSALAITDAVRRGPTFGEVFDEDARGVAGQGSTYLRAVATQGPLLEGERLVDAAINNLLLASEAPNEQTLSEVATALGRIEQHWRSLLPAMPAGLRDPLLSAVTELQRYADWRSGVPAIRRDELHAVTTADALVLENRRLADTLSTRVDLLVRTAQDSVSAATLGVRTTIVRHTTALALLSIAAVASAVFLSYFFVIRDLGSGMRGVTTAMRRLAQGERSVPVPATDRPDEIGDLARAFIVFRDNARRMDALDRQLLEKSNLLLATFDNMNDGFTVFDEAARLLAWNPQYVRLYDFSQDELTLGVRLSAIQRRLAERGTSVFSPLGALVPPEDLASGGSEDVQRHEVHLPNGRILELRTNPIPAGGFVTIHTDVTERKAVEAQLRQAQKMEVVGQLSGGLAHDFNNMLAVIQGNLHLLDDALADQPELRDRVERALAAGDRAAMQIERLLAVSRRQKLSPEDVDLSGLITGMVDLLDYSVGDAIEIKTDLVDDLPPVFVDPGQLENAILNLAVNARDAMTDAGIITIAARIDQKRDSRDAKEFVDLAVRDTGCGMDRETLDRVFEPFFTTKERGKGSGLGLSMVYGFVRQSGGDVSIESVPGTGTTIHLLLPMADTVREPSIQSTGQGVASTRSPGCCVLVVEDDPELRDVSAARLRGMGCQVLEATDADEALACLGENPGIDLLFTDIVLGAGANGFELARVACAEHSKLRVIFTSGESTDVLTKLPGYDQHAEILKKPVHPVTLSEAIRRRVEAVPDTQTVSTSASKT